MYGQLVWRNGHGQGQVKEEWRGRSKLREKERAITEGLIGRDEYGKSK